MADITSRQGKQSNKGGEKLRREERLAGSLLVRKQSSSATYQEALMCMG